MANGSSGMSGSTFDAFVSSQRSQKERDWAAKVQEKYWRAKQKFLASVEKKEDSCIILSDSKLDSKLEIYHSIDKSCARLTNILESYQNSLYSYSNEENALGILLKECGKHDKTKAGKIMNMTGRSLTQSSHQRIRLYMPLLRLYQEMETFHSRAVEDTADTVDKLESKRSQYRASLLWMKDISEKLDPDVYRQLDKFRWVQSKVREDKKSFDGMQMDVVQKIDLLMASRCNLMNQILAPYQALMLEALEKNHNNFKSVEELIKSEDFYEYEFKTLKQLNPLKISDDSPVHQMNVNNSNTQTIVDNDLLGSFNDDSSRRDDNNNSEGSLTQTANHNSRSEALGEPPNLVDVALEESNVHLDSTEAKEDNKANTLGLLETLFGNKDRANDQTESNVASTNTDVKDKKLITHTDLKTLMSNINSSLLDVECDEEKQIASLLGPSEMLQNTTALGKAGNSMSLIDDDGYDEDDIFARWARDADIDLSSDKRQVGEVPKNNNLADGNDNGKNSNLMDMEPAVKGPSHFYA